MPAMLCLLNVSCINTGTTEVIFIYRLVPVGDTYYRGFPSKRGPIVCKALVVFSSIPDVAALGRQTLKRGFRLPSGGKGGRYESCQ